MALLHFRLQIQQLLSTYVSILREGYGTGGTAHGLL
jgi:hypothetical protein